MATTKPKDWLGHSGCCKSWKIANKMALLHCPLASFRVSRIRNMDSISDEIPEKVKQQLIGKSIWSHSFQVSVYYKPDCAIHESLGLSRLQAKIKIFSDDFGVWDWSSLKLSTEIGRGPENRSEDRLGIA
jgi:hypothetical protein